jgi:predicted ATP-grasp superfamily ATP-dependent carboligase
MTGLEFPILLQEFIPGPPDAGYFLEGFVDRRGQMSALVGRRRLRMYPASVGNSSFTATVPVDEIAAADSLSKLLRAMNFRGIFNAEFKRDARDGQLKLLEVNPRAWWYVGFAGNCGVNTCRMAYQDALGLPVEPVTNYETGRRCFFLANELRAWKEGRRNGGIRLWPLIRSWYGADEALFRWGDPLPAIVHLAQQMLPGLAGSEGQRTSLASVSATRQT